MNPGNQSCLKLKIHFQIFNGTLESLHLETLRAMVKDEKVKIKYKGSMPKDKLLSAIKSKFVVIDS